MEVLRAVLAKSRWVTEAAKSRQVMNKSADHQSTP